MDIVKQLNIDFCEVFDGKLSAFTLSKVRLSIDKNAKPIVHKPRPVPLAWKSKIESELKKFVETGVLEPVDDSEWACPIVPIAKASGKLRICEDCKVTISRFLSDFKYPLPRIEEIFATHQGGQLFTINIG